VSLRAEVQARILGLISALAPGIVFADASRPKQGGHAPVGWLNVLDPAMDQTLFIYLVDKLDRAGMRHLDGSTLTAVVVAAWLLLVLILLICLRSVSYRVGRKHLKILVAGVPVRRVRLDNIRNIHTRKVRCLERWHNMLFPTADRLVVIEKRRGLLKRILITPEQRYVFKS
jgi:hypothetical protein